MTLYATAADKDAYSKLGGAMDNISDAYAYVVKGLSVADDGRLDPLANSGRLSKFVKVTSAAQKAFSYFRKIQEAFDAKTRDGAILKLGVKIAVDVAGKVLGKSLSTHPYYAYHKAQIDALADALNAHRNANEAIEAFKKAVNAADSQKLTAEFKRIENRKTSISASISDFKKLIPIAHDIARGMGSAQYLKKKIAEHGSDKLEQAVADLDTWRANLAGLAYDALQLQIMAASELQVAREAMAQVQDLMKTLMSGSNTNRVMGYGAYNAIQWEQYEQMVRGGKSSKLMRDPVNYAEDNLEKAEAWGRVFSEWCDFCRGEEVYFEGRRNLQLDKVNKVLYG